MCEKLDVSFFIDEKLGFLEKLIKHKCFRLLDLGDIVYPQLVKSFCANLETTSTANGMFFVSIVKFVKITLTCYVLESIFGLKLVDTTPPNLTPKQAQDLCPTKGRQHVTDLTPKEASALKVSLPDHRSSYNLTTACIGLKEDHADLRNKLDHIQLEMGLMNKKINALI
ncbi:hypothetical protein Cgig2_006678 [Carnegiea gigantea]|uniref:Uncharacterized protein n=1 Tax=Carnegiea gigantea TaxID=171969 RepID=A0A9Q1GR71_9CARY|nr:hypothetical protein Cgig2_006678 [Carnegiea gigantea]